jgi:hypothetical protein
LLFYFKKKYDQKTIRYIYKKRDVAATEEEFKFQLETKRSSRGQRSIKLGTKLEGVTL